MQTTNKKALVLLTISLLTIFTFTPFSVATSGTQVGGIVNADTVWAKGNSPYSLTSPVIVGYGAKLTIEAGTVIDLNGYNLQVNGILYARGSNTQNIAFNSVGGGMVSFTASSSSWNENTQTGSIIEGSVLNGVYIQVHTTSPKISNNTIYPSADINSGITVDMESGAPLIVGNYLNGTIECLDGASPTIMGNYIRNGGIMGQGFSMAAPVIINNTIIGGSSLMLAGSGIYADGCGYYVANNTIAGCITALALDEGNNIVEGNLIINYTNAIFISGSSTTGIIRHNTICNNAIGISISNYDYPSANIIYNNMINNTKYNFKSLNVTYNWWGTTNQTAIGALLSSSTVYLPFLTSPDATAPAVPDSLNQIIVPTNSPSPAISPSPSPSAAVSQPLSVQPTATPNSATEKPSATPYQASEAIPELTVLIAAGFIALSLFTATVVFYRRSRGQLGKPAIV